MPPESPKPALRPAKGARPRRTGVRLRPRTVRERLRELAEHPSVGWSVVIGVVLVVAVSTAGNWAREQPLVAVGQVMNQTRTVRVRFAISDERETEREREAARQRTARVYAQVPAALEELRSSLENLPGALGGAATLDEVDRPIRVRFGLSEESLAAVRAIAEDPARAQAWSAGTGALLEILSRRPILDAAAFQAARQEGLNPRIELRAPGGGSMVGREEAINAGDPQQLARDVATIVRLAGFEGALGELVAHRVTHETRPTFTFDADATAAAQERAAAGVTPVRREYAVGQTIFNRGDVLDGAQHALYVRELREFRAQAGAERLWTRRLAVAGTCAVMVGLLGGYLATFCPRIARRSARVAWIAALLGTSVVGACVLTVLDPRFGALAVPGPAVLVAVLLRIAYDRRTAAAVASVGAVIACLSLDAPIGTFALCLAGIGAAVGSLGEVRDRREIIRMSLVTAATLGLGAVLVGLVDRPVTPTSAAAARAQTLAEAVLAGVGGLLVGGVTLFVLPFIERVFDITTGMTLIELRDPKQPLLREMQQRAPGTYNHSLNVASIAEAAAESIGADSLLTYVGCLYHDVGKITKPEYFVENQRRGFNRHDKLSPAMSLLIIVGHVKDGVEMAREHGLPRPLIHFIEAHHGTTLVEFFFNRAQEQSRPAGDDTKRARDEAPRPPDEIDYRYPGPKPRTKEVAIAMLADAVESATRTLPEPTSSRIEALVRKIADRRLADGQFDECDLTLREVRMICDSISKSVASIYHGRIQYASTADAPDPETAAGVGSGERSA